MRLAVISYHSSTPICIRLNKIKFVTMFFFCIFREIGKYISIIDTMIKGFLLSTNFSLKVSCSFSYQKIHQRQ